MTKLHYLVAIMSLLSFLFAGCSKQSAPQSSASPDTPVLKVAVFRDGHFTVDGADSSLPALRESLKRHSERKGVVWYYREAGQEEAPPVAMDVLKTMMEARLPIRMSSRADYSDTIDEQGRSVIAK